MASKNDLAQSSSTLHSEDRVRKKNSEIHKIMSIYKRLVDTLGTVEDNNQLREILYKMDEKLVHLFKET